MSCGIELKIPIRAKSFQDKKIRRGKTGEI